MPNPNKAPRRRFKNRKNRLEARKPISKKIVTAPKMAPSSSRIGWSKDVYNTREKAHEAGLAYLNSLEPRFQAGRSFKVRRMTGTSGTNGPGTFVYDIYLGTRPIETYRKGGGWQDS